MRWLVLYALISIKMLSELFSRNSSQIGSSKQAHPQTFHLFNERYNRTYDLTEQILHLRVSFGLRGGETWPVFGCFRTHARPPLRNKGSTLLLARKRLLADKHKISAKTGAASRALSGHSTNTLRLCCGSQAANRPSATQAVCNDHSVNEGALCSQILFCSKARTHSMTVVFGRRTERGAERSNWRRPEPVLKGSLQAT